MFTFLRIERPTIATLRPHRRATSTACCIRWMFEANDATRIAARAQRDDLAERLADDALRPRHARPLGVRRVAEQQVDAAVSELGELADVGAQPVDGRVVELVVARVEDRARRACRGTTATQSGIECAIRTNSMLERAELDRLAVRVGLAQLGGAQEAVLVELRLHEPEREARRDDLSHPHLAQEVRERADVVLVAVREDDGAHACLALAQVREVREDEVDAEVLVAREREACVDDDDRRRPTS